MLIQKGVMTTDQITYLFIMPFIFILFAKVNFLRTSSRKDFIKSLKLDSNRKVMRQTLIKRYFGETLTEKFCTIRGDLVEGDDMMDFNIFY